MFSDQQARDAGSGDSGFNGRRPWYGPRRYGFGYGPQTWQGFLVSALSVAAVIVAGTLAKGTPWFYAVIIVVVAVHLVIIAVQRPR
jgi:hypothetical protein